MRVVVADPIAAEGVELLRRGCEVTLAHGSSREQLLAALAEAEALVVRSETKVDRALIEAAGRLKVIGRAGVGVDNIDVAAATERGIVVVNAPTGNTIAAAEHAVALLMSLARNIPQAHASVAGGSWERRRFAGSELRGKTLGLVGLGRIGTEVARRARGLELQVLAYDPYISQEAANQAGARLVPLDLLLGAADFISIHTPLTERTRNLLGRRELSLCKPGAYLINAARGGLVDETALADALDSGRLAGAALDVFSSEPPVDNRLVGHAKVVHTPHVGASTREAQISVALDIAEQVLAVLNDRVARYAVNMPLTRPEQIGKLAPYLELAERLAEVGRQLVRGPIETIELGLWGEAAETDSRAIKAAVVKGILKGISEENVNLVNAHLVANRRGLSISERVGAEDLDSYTSLVNLKLGAAAQYLEIAGSVMRKEPHVVRVGPYWLDFVPQPGDYLFCYFADMPGIIGRVGTILGESGINVTSMQMARIRSGGRALMILGLDSTAPEALVAQLTSSDTVRQAFIVRVEA